MGISSTPRLQQNHMDNRYVQAKQFVLTNFVLIVLWTWQMRMSSRFVLLLKDVFNNLLTNCIKVHFLRTIYKSPKDNVSCSIKALCHFNMVCVI